MKHLFLSVAFAITFIACNGQHGHSSHGHGNKNTSGPIQVEKPTRVTHAYEQTLSGAVKDIMPLYCPVKESYWAEGWHPDRVYSNSGWVEKDCMFITSHGDQEIIWIVNEYDLEKNFVEMIYVVPNSMVTKLQIKAREIAPNKSKALITYTKTALSEKGKEMVHEYTKEEYMKMMNHWEKSMNHYLTTGETLKTKSGHH